MCVSNVQLYLRCFKSPPTERKIDSVVADCKSFAKKKTFFGVVVIVPVKAPTSLKELELFKKTKIGKAACLLTERTNRRFNKYMNEIRYVKGASQIVYIVMFNRWVVL